MKWFLSILSLSILAVMLTFFVGCFYNYFYPLKFQDEIVAASNEREVDGALVAAIINVESGYNENAISSRGAVGLMQIMPETAQWLCKKIGIEYDENALTDAKTNITLGSEYLKILLNTFADQDTAICAYNAGPGNVKTWLADENNSKDGKTLFNIPFKETKEFLNKVKKSLRYYERKY